MKKIILFAVLGSVLAFFACQKDNSNLATDTASLNDREFAFGVSDRGDSTSFTLTPITFSELPLAAQTYLLANSDTSLIAKIIKVTDPNGVVRYVVGFEGHTRLGFDADGNLLALPTGGGHHGGGHPPHDSIPGGGHPPHDSIPGGGHPPHDSIPGGGHPPHDSIPGGGHPGGGHPGGGHQHGH